MKRVLWIEKENILTREVLDLHQMADCELTLHSLPKQVKSYEDLADILQDYDAIAFRNLPRNVIKELLDLNNNPTNTKLIRSIGQEIPLPVNEKGEQAREFVYDHWEIIYTQEGRGAKI